MQHTRRQTLPAAALAIMFSSFLVQPAAGQKFKVIDSLPADFNLNGSGAESGLLLHGGNLIGASRIGGANGLGTVYEVAVQTGPETILHSFAGAPTDGANPYGGLAVDSAGNLYGTTFAGGTNDLGTVFELDPAGNLTVLHSFSGADGSGPRAGVIRDGAGNLYGTTWIGGSLNGGTVFRLSSSGRFTTLYNFGGGTDGTNPYDSLLLQTGVLYGTTYLGGVYGYGTVFQVDARSGQETVIYSFTGGADGANPVAAVVSDGQGNLYSTTDYGGAGLGVAGYGVVFELNISSGQLTTLHTFGGPDGTDGGNPIGGLVRDSLGNLFGTTFSYGARGGGTLFQLDAAANLTTLHAFGGAPAATPIRDPRGNLYGTTDFGGQHIAGTVWVVVP
jgi:uncharacterized repeat protein (TIGR03803 family)